MNEIENRMGTVLEHASVVVCFCVLFGSAFGAEKPDLTEAIARRHRITATDEWYGGRRTVFDFDGYEAWVVEPPAGTRVAEGRPWTWTMQWATAFVKRTGVPALLKLGYHHVTIVTFKDRMDENGLRVSAKFQKYLVDELGFAPKADLIGMSWGGFFSTRYAVTYPENVHRIYLDAPLLCFKDFDPAKEKPEARRGPWAATAPADGKWSDDPRMPVNLAAKLAATRIPIFLLHNGQDQSCPKALNALPFIERYKAAGGEKNLKILYREFYGHHPHGPDETGRAVVDFFSAKADGSAEAAFTAALDRLRASVWGGEITEIHRYRTGDAEPAWMKGAPDCAIIHFTLKPTSESAIHCRLLLPPPDKWDGRFWGVGNQDRGADIADWLFREWQLPRLKAGSAACLADMGTWDGRHGREVVRDFGWRACHEMTVEAKKLVAAFYGRTADRNYFIGLSSGGGQGIHEALRFPEDYDGIVAYVPAHARTALARQGRNFHLMTHDANGNLVVTPEQCAAVADAAIRHFASREAAPFAGQCVTDVRYSRADADAILKLAAEKLPELAEEDLQRRWRGIWEGPEIDGRHPAGGAFGADFSCILSRDNFLASIAYGPEAKAVSKMSNAEFERFIADVADDCDATGTDLARFAARGKLIVVSGTVDPIVSPRTAWDWCERLAERFGGADNLKPFFRTYFLPGRNHCNLPTGRDGVCDVDTVTALLDWCEKGRAPGALKGRLRSGQTVDVSPWGW